MYMYTYIHADQTCQMFQLANRFSTVSNTPNETSVFVTQCRSLSNIPFVNKSKISIFNVSNRGYWFVVVSFESMTRKQFFREFFYHPQQQALHRHFQHIDEHSRNRRTSFQYYMYVMCMLGMPSPLVS